MTAREAAIFLSLVEAAVAPQPPLPAVDQTDACDAFARYLAASPAVSRALTVQKIATTVQLTVAPEPSTPGGSITLTVNVMAASGAGGRTSASLMGTVTFTDEKGRRIRCHDNGEDYARLRAALRRAMRGGWYRASESLLRRDSLSDFNDGCNDFGELRAVIVQARATAMNDADPWPAPRPRLDIERDELVIA